MIKGLDSGSIRAAKCKPRIRINVGGEIFETYPDTLSRFPDTLLGSRRTRKFHYSTTRRELLFTRDKICFEAILYFYQSNGRLNCPEGVPLAVFEAECRHFRIPREFISHLKRREGIIELNEPEQCDDCVMEKSVRRKFWDLIENPESSHAAWTFACLSMCMVWASIVVAIAATVDAPSPHPTNIKTDASHYTSTLLKRCELALNVWFLLELLLRRVKINLLVSINFALLVRVGRSAFIFFLFTLSFDR